jgi:hypothetical protein
MTSSNVEPMTCAEFRELLGDYLDAQALAPALRAAADAHVASCVECSALLADVRAIVRDAQDLPVLAPSRDLWSGIEQRIEAPVLAIGRKSGERAAIDADTTDERRVAYGERAAYRVRRLAVAASLLVAVTAGVTYTLTKRQAATPNASSPLVAPNASSPLARAVSRPSASETFDAEIASLRTIVDARRAELDTATIRVVEKNLKLIDAAIAESKAALASDPASAFLTEQLTHAYDTKLRLLRGLATLPARS